VAASRRCQRSCHKTTDSCVLLHLRIRKTPRIFICGVKERAKRNALFLFARDSRPTRSSKRLAAKPRAPCFGFVGVFAASCPDAGPPNRASRGALAQSTGGQLCWGRLRISTGRVPSDPAAARILRERESCRSARFCARFRGARPRLLLTFVGHSLSMISDRLKSDACCKNCPAEIG
jgi:hypothetical protein